MRRFTTKEEFIEMANKNKEKLGGSPKTIRSFKNQDGTVSFIMLDKKEELAYMFERIPGSNILERKNERVIKLWGRK